MKENKTYRLYRTIMIVALTAFITFMLTTVFGYQYISHNPGKTLLLSSSEKEDISGEITKYKSLIDQYYLGEVDEEKLKEGAIKGYIEGLGDPYTEYISKEEMKDYLEDTMGNYVGIGIYMTKDTEIGKIRVLTPIKNSPAEKAGLKPGDIILSVEGEVYSADEMTVASNKIKGEEGTTVNIQVLRETQTLDFEIKRESIKVNPVDGKVLESQIGYISFSSFDETTAEDFKVKYEELKKQNIKSLIIDLRNNGGGLVSQALKITDYMTDKGSVLLYEVDKNGNEEVKKGNSEPMITMPIILLTNENTASASEILAGALKDLGKARIVGTKTYGKGVIQQVLSLKDGSGIKITTDEYQTPSRHKINKIGIEPNEEVKLPDSVKNSLTIPEGQDTQLQKAMELLK